MISTAVLFEPGRQAYLIYAIEIPIGRSLCKLVYISDASMTWLLLEVKIVLEVRSALWRQNVGCCPHAGRRRDNGKQLQLETKSLPAQIGYTGLERSLRKMADRVFDRCPKSCKWETFNEGFTGRDLLREVPEPQILHKRDS